MFGVQKHDHQAQNINYSSKHVKPQTTDSVNQNYSIKVRCETQGWGPFIILGRGMGMGILKNGED